MDSLSHLYSSSFSSIPTVPSTLLNRGQHACYPPGHTGKARPHCVCSLSSHHLHPGKELLNLIVTTRKGLREACGQRTSLTPEGLREVHTQQYRAGSPKPGHTGIQLYGLTDRTRAKDKEKNQYAVMASGQMEKYPVNQEFRKKGATDL